MRDYLTSLEARLAENSDRLEEIHMEAAIDAQLTETASNQPIFNDYTNPHAVDNCLSPYVPTKAAQIAAFLDFVPLSSADILLDLGCGDGRVAVAAAKWTGCRAIGVDISPPCLKMALELAKEEGVADRCTFIKADATKNIDRLLQQGLESATVVFLYTYPTLLQSLVPILARLPNVRACVTLTYHLPHATVVQQDDQNDLRLYSTVTEPSG